MNTLEHNNNINLYLGFSLILIITTILSSIVIVIGPLGTIFMLIFVSYATSLLVKYCKTPNGDYFNSMLLGVIVGTSASFVDSFASIAINKSIEFYNVFNYIMKDFFSFFFHLSYDLFVNIPICVICALVSTAIARGIIKTNND